MFSRIFGTSQNSLNTVISHGLDISQCKGASRQLTISQHHATSNDPLLLGNGGQPLSASWGPCLGHSNRTASGFSQAVLLVANPRVLTCSARPYLYWDFVNKTCGRGAQVASLFTMFCLPRPFVLFTTTVDLCSFHYQHNTIRQLSLGRANLARWGGVEQENCLPIFEFVTQKEGYSQNL